MTPRAALAVATLALLATATMTERASAEPVPLDDAALGAASGAPAGRSLPVIAVRGETPVFPTAAGSVAGSGTGAAPSSVPAAAPGSVAAGSLRSFAVDMSSAFTSPGAGETTTYHVDQRVGIDLTTAVPAVTIERSATQISTPGGRPSSTVDSVSGTLAGKVTGVAQRISIAGNNNAALNAATLEVTHGSALTALGAPATAAGGETSCGSACATTASVAGIGVAIDLPNGSAMQSIGSGSLWQDAVIAGDSAVVVNELRLAVGVGPAGARPSLPTLQTGLGLSLPVGLPH